MKSLIMALAILPWNRESTIDLTVICSVAVAVANANGGDVKPNPEAAIIEPVPRVQIVIYSDSPRCQPCRDLIGRMKPRLIEKGWTFGVEKHNRFRVVEYETNEAEFTKRNITTVPTVVIVTDGDEMPTSKRDAAELASEYLERLTALP
jgi:hypothetical protein